MTTSTLPPEYQYIANFFPKETRDELLKIPIGEFLKTARDKYNDLIAAKVIENKELDVLLKDYSSAFLPQQRYRQWLLKLPSTVRDELERLPPDQFYTAAWNSYNALTDRKLKQELAITAKAIRDEDFRRQKQSFLYTPSHKIRNLVQDRQSHVSLRNVLHHYDVSLRKHQGDLTKKFFFHKNLTEEQAEGIVDLYLDTGLRKEMDIFSLSRCRTSLIAFLTIEMDIYWARGMLEQLVKQPCSFKRVHKKEKL